MIHPEHSNSYLLRLEAGRVEVCVEEDNGEGEDEGGVGGAGVELGDEVGVALAVPLAEHLHQALDLLRLARHAEVRLELAQGCEEDWRGGRMVRRNNANYSHNKPICSCLVSFGRVRNEQIYSSN